MELSYDYPLKITRSVQPSNIIRRSETEYPISTNEDGYNKPAKYRSIPVGKNLEGWIRMGGTKAPPVNCENVSGVKEIKRPKPITLKDNTFPPGLSTITHKQNSNKNHSKLDSKLSINTVQQKRPPFSDRTGPISVSEPTLVANDRGDNATLQSIYRDNDLTKNPYFGDVTVVPPKKEGIKGCIYIKSSGKVYKSLIAAEKAPSQVDDIGWKYFGLQNKRACHKIQEDSVFAANGMKVGNDACGDFEVAIFLSGIKSLPDNSHSRKNENESAVKHEKRVKKKRNFRIKDTFVTGKKSETIRKSYPSSVKFLEVNPQGKKGKYLQQSQDSTISYGDSHAINRTYKVTDAAFEFSSGSDSEHVYELAEMIPKNKLKNASVNSSNVVRGILKPSESQTYRYRKNDHGSCRSKIMSQSSFGQFSDDYRIPKLKIPEKELWAKFENMFREYASTTLHSGEVIPRRISTEWMVNAGVVDDILSEKQADEAFRQAAGTKITMNSQEYKEFLIMLTLRMKLPYYEIYRRMCGA